MQVAVAGGRTQGEIGTMFMPAVRQRSTLAAGSLLHSYASSLVFLRRCDDQS